MRFHAVAAGAIPLHVLVRDFPELLAVLRQAGLDVPAAGGWPLGAAALPTSHDSAHALVEALAAATAWRVAAPPGPCDRAAEQALAHAATAAGERARAAGT